MSKPLINKLIEKITLLKKDNLPLIIGIDGPTAAGKTFLANNLKTRIKKKFRSVWICQLDWTLKNRNYRSKSLQTFKDSKTNFYYESQDHMNLIKISECLKKIKNFNYRNKNLVKIKLNSLYNREKANNNLSVSTKISGDSLIIVEGHYTSIPNFEDLINYNILLLGEKNELLKRKINRVKHYRSPKQTTEYFNLIDVPSFVNHLSLHNNNYDLIVDNTSYLKPVIKNKDYSIKWINKVSNYRDLKEDNLDKFIKSSFYPAVIENYNLKNFFKLFVKEITKFDTFVSNNIKINIQEINIDLTNFLHDSVEKINRNIKSKNTKLNLQFTNNFHKIYYKSPPFFAGFQLNKIQNNSKDSINLIIKIKNKEFEIDIYWKGGVETINFKRDIGKIYKDYKFLFKKKNISDLPLVNKNNKDLTAFIPTDFLYFSFIDNYYKVKQIFTNREESTISAVDILENYFSKEVFWIHRFSKFCERDFFQRIVYCIGANSFAIGNYLISFKINDRNLASKLKDFLKNWSPKGNNVKIEDRSKKKYDLKIDQDRKIFVDFINSKTKLFKAFDNSLFLSKGSFFNVNKDLLKKDLFILLSSKHRSVRKGISLLIEKNFNNLPLNISELWEDKVDTNKKTISLNSLTNISPTILSDLYFWLSLKKDSSSILASNVYDIRRDSFDIESYLEAAQSINSPIVIQSSVNAIGPKSKNKNKVVEGYLKLKDGSGEFVKSTYESARNIYIKNEKNFLFGIGIDHIDVRYDKPKGRIKKFIKSLQESNLVTHYTLDGSHILEKNIKKNFLKEKRSLFKQVINYETDIIKLINNYNIFDYEFCSSELNYVGNDKKVFIPSTKDMIFFSESLFKKLDQSDLGLVNMRPKLIIGNLGTTHHGHDNKSVKVETSEVWIENTKKFGLVSAVLHGTSRSHPETLKNAVGGCKKINVAGDFLQCLVSNLPEKLKSIVKSKNDQEKTKLHLIRNNLKNIAHKKKEQIKSSLKYKCLDIMRNINSPTLTEQDINYFKYKLYNYNSLQIKSITNSIFNEINNFKKININLKKTNSVFLPSPIEVDYGNNFKKLISSSNKLGYRRFHIDVGDGKFINRVLNVENKVSYIKDLSPKNIVHLHLMAMNPHYGNKESYINKYANLGADNIGIHRKSFSNPKEIYDGINAIKATNKNVGLFLEVDEIIDEEVLNTIVKNNINWVVLMGVPVGFGGQFFNEQILFKSITLRKFALKNKLDLKIEIDGGLNRDNILLCQNFGADYLAGWSLVKSANIEGYKKNLSLIKKKLKNV